MPSARTSAAEFMAARKSLLRWAAITNSGLTVTICWHANVLPLARRLAIICSTRSSASCCEIRSTRTPSTYTEEGELCGGIIFTCGNDIPYPQYLPGNNFCFNIAYHDIWPCLFNITLNMPQNFTGMLAIICYATDTEYGNLPAILFLDLGNRHFKTVTHPCNKRLDDLPFIF